MANQTDADAPAESFDDLEELLAALRGEGWIVAQEAGDPENETTGFRIAGFEVTRHAYDPGHTWVSLGSWTTGAGDGYTVYRGRVAGHLVDWVDVSSWPNTNKTAFVAVHDSDPRDDGSFPENRETDKHEWKEGVGDGYRRPRRVLPTDEESEN